MSAETSGNDPYDQGLPPQSGELLCLFRGAVRAPAEITPDSPAADARAGFSRFCLQEREEPIDVTTTDPAQQPALSLAALDFLNDAADKWIQRNPRDDGGPRGILAGKHRVQRHVRQYYEQFPVGEVTDDTNAERIDTHVKEGDTLARKYGRNYPELKMLITLHQGLRENQNAVAAAGVHILFIEYGWSFTELRHPY